MITRESTRSEAPLLHHISVLSCGFTPVLAQRRRDGAAMTPTAHADGAVRDDLAAGPEERRTVALPADAGAPDITCRSV